MTGKPEVNSCNQDVNAQNSPRLASRLHIERQLSQDTFNDVLPTCLHSARLNPDSRRAVLVLIAVHPDRCPLVLVGNTRTLTAWIHNEIYRRLPFVSDVELSGFKRLRHVMFRKVLSLCLPPTSSGASSSKTCPVGCRLFRCLHKFNVCSAKAAVCSE
jgi:hypothetical protein